MKPRIPLPAPLATGPFAYSTGLQHASPKRLRGSDLGAPFRGTRAVATAPTDVEHRARAFATRMPAEAFFNSATAAIVHGIPVPLPLESSRRIHVAVPLPRRATQTSGVIGHAVTLMGDDCTVVRGLRVSTVCRTWCELAALLDLHDLVAAGDHIIHHRLPLASLEDLVDAVAHYPGRRGRATLRRALPLLSERAESPQESRLRSILMTGGIGGLRPNLWVTVRGRRLRIDIAIPQHRLAIEYQSDYHLDLGQRRKDLTRASILASDEWLTLEFNSDDMGAPHEVVERVLATLRTRPRFAP